MTEIPIEAHCSETTFKADDSKTYSPKPRHQKEQQPTTNHEDNEKKTKDTSALRASSDALMKNALRGHFKTLALRQEIAEAEQVFDLVAEKMAEQRRASISPPAADDDHHRNNNNNKSSNSDSPAPVAATAVVVDEAALSAAAADASKATVDHLQREFSKKLRQVESTLKKRARRSEEKLFDAVEHIRSLTRVVVDSRGALEVHHSSSSPSPSRANINHSENENETREQPQGEELTTATTTTIESLLRTLATELDGFVSLAFSAVVESNHQTHPSRHQRTIDAIATPLTTVEAQTAASAQHEALQARRDADEQALRADRFRVQLRQAQDTIKRLEASLSDRDSLSRERAHEEEEEGKTEDHHHHHQHEGVFEDDDEKRLSQDHRHKQEDRNVFSSEFRLRQLQEENARLVSEVDSFKEEARASQEQAEQLQINASKWRMEADMYKGLYEAVVEQLQGAERAITLMKPYVPVKE